MATSYRSGLYRIRNLTNGKVYVGSSVCVGRRLTQHRSSLRKGQHKNPHLQASWNLYGEKCFSFEPVVFCPEHQLLEQEQVLLDEGVGDYNIAENAQAPWRGKRRSAATRAKISAAQVGTKQSPETVAKRIRANTGQKRTPEQIQRMRKAALGRTPSEACQKAQRAHCQRVSKPVQAQSLEDGSIEHFPSKTAANAAGFNERSVGRAIKSGKPFKNRLWTLLESAT